MHFTSLPSAFGIGDIADASLEFAGQLAAMKLKVWQVLPAGPTGYGDSPYQPLSAFAGNELLVGPGPLLAEGLLNESEVAQLRALPADRVNYGALIPPKLAALALAAERFLARQADSDQVGYEAFLEENDARWLHEYARFRVLKRLHGDRCWQDWSPELARREPAALREVESTHRLAIEKIKVIQYFFHRQWLTLRRHCEDRGILLFGDLPIYIALDSADAWSHPELLRLDADGHPSQVAGVPPDYFSKDGQLWGNPLYDWSHHAGTGFRWWIDRLGHWARRCDLVRVDHFRGFESYWSVPAGEKTARKGRWIQGPGDDLFEALRRELGDLPMVAEDLGVITPKVDKLRRRHGLPGMKVLQFELASAKFEPDDVPEDCMCYTATHDNDTTAGWFSGKSRDGRTRREIRDTRRNTLRITGGKARNVYRDLLRLALDTSARVAIAPMQDFLGLGSEARLNTPGTDTGNWRWRMLSRHMPTGFREEISLLIEQSGRG